MSKVKTGDKIKIHYKGTLDNGHVFDNSEGRDPLEFVVGAGTVIPGFDNGVVDMEVGEKKTIDIPCAEAYGEKRPELELLVERDKLPPELDPKVGDTLQVPQQGQSVPLLVTVTEVTTEVIKIDANHPLAGKDLTFDLELVEIAEA